MIENTINWLLNWFNSLLTIEPISLITLPQLLILYIEYFILAITLVLPFFLIFRVKEKKTLGLTETLFKKNPELAETLFINVPIENFIFRIIPIWGLGGTSAGVGAHIIWAILHGFPSCIFVVFHGLLALRLWLGGLWIEGFFIHFFHDLICVPLEIKFKK